MKQFLWIMACTVLILCSSGVSACEKGVGFSYKVENMEKRLGLCTWLSVRFPSHLPERYKLAGVELVQYDNKKQVDFSSLLDYGIYKSTAAVNVCMDLTQKDRYLLKVRYMPKAPKEEKSRCVIEHEINVFDFAVERRVEDIRP